MVAITEPIVKTRLITLAEMSKPASEGRLYAVLDACDAPMIYSKVRELDESQSVCLYSGSLSPEVLGEAPYLVRVNPALLDWIQQEVWKTPWGIFIIGDANLRVLRKHLRHFLRVKGPEGDVFYFRYYDPRVLLPFLASCNAEELKEFFGPVLAYASVRGEKLILCWHSSFK